MAENARKGDTFKLTMELEMSAHSAGAMQSFAVVLVEGTRVHTIESEAWLIDSTTHKVRHTFQGVCPERGNILLVWDNNSKVRISAHTWAFLM